MINRIETILFQFHYGSIKTLSVDGPNFNYIVFQFHYGSIKTNIDSSDVPNRYISIPLWFD